jgi:hypothetical protein
LTRHVWPDFFARNADALRGLDADLARSLGPAPMLADTGHAPAARLAQFVVHEATKALVHQSVALFDTKPDLDDALATDDAASHLPPRLAKLVNVPVPLTTDTLVVVHAHSVFDGAESAKAGIDREVASYKARGLPVVYLMTDEGDADFGWYPEDRAPTYAVYSAGGEHNLPLVTDTLTLAGGFFGDETDDHHGCHFRAMMDAISRHALVGNGRPLTIRLPLDAIYYYEEDEHTVRDFVNGKTTTAAFLDDVVDLFFPEEGRPYLGSEIQASGAGELTPAAFRFEFAIDGELARAPIGAPDAANTVRFDFRTPAAHREVATRSGASSMSP